MVRVNRIAAMVVVQIKKSGFAVIDNSYDALQYVHENIDTRKYHVYNTGKRIFIIPKFEGDKYIEFPEERIIKSICKLLGIESHENKRV